MKTTCSIRKMQESDIKNLSRGFISQGWPSREEILTRYFKEQESGEREVLVAEVTQDMDPPRDCTSNEAIFQMGRVFGIEINP